MSGKYKSKAAPHAVYRGSDVKLFSQDLSNYSELRRGLSPQMRAQTMTKKELRNVSPDICALVHGVSSVCVVANALRLNGKLKN